MGRIGLLGGTFDPIHNAHIYMGKVAKKFLSLNKVIYIPAGVLAHKKAHTDDAKLRHDMVRLAIDGIEGFEVSDYETKKQTPSYSVETVEYFKSIYPDDELVFIVGEDSLDYVDRWYMADKLLSMCSFAVIGRGGFESDIDQKIAQLESEYRATVYCVEAEEIELASKNIRAMIAAGEDASALLPEKVAEFIQKNDMYKK